MNLYAYVFSNPVNWEDPLGLWSIGGNFYYGYGGFFRFGQSNGQWFVRGGFGFGLGGGVEWIPTDKLPGSSEDTKCGSEGFIGASANAAVSLGPLSGTLGGAAGWHITQGSDGRPQINYVEDGGLEGSLTGERGFGVKAVVNVNIIDVGVTL